MAYDLKDKKIFIGTSGWSYEHWEGVFYPAGIKKPSWLDFYAEHFSTVEINNSFYRLPKKDTFRKWADITPEGFIFSVKASRYITHIKRLKDPKSPIKKLIESAKGLSGKLGPFLLQFPSNFAKDAGRLSAFCKELPASNDFVFEFRHKSWLDDEVFELLDREGCGIVLSDSPDFPKAETITARTCYIRMHGRTRLYQSYYQKNSLEEIADFLANKSRDFDKAFIYFNNDHKGHAVKDAMKMKDLLGI